MLEKAELYFGHLEPEQRRIATRLWRRGESIAWAITKSRKQLNRRELIERLRARMGLEEGEEAERVYLGGTVAGMLDIDLEEVSRLCADGRIKNAVHFGGDRWVIREGGLREYIDEQRRIISSTSGRKAGANNRRRAQVPVMDSEDKE